VYGLDMNSLSCSTIIETCYLFFNLLNTSFISSLCGRWQQWCLTSLELDWNYRYHRMSYRSTDHWAGWNCRQDATWIFTSLDYMMISLLLFYHKTINVSEIETCTTARVVDLSVGLQINFSRGVILSPHI
jgi:hypothetical protein